MATTKPTTRSIRHTHGNVQLRAQRVLLSPQRLASSATRARLAQVRSLSHAQRVRSVLSVRELRAQRLRERVALAQVTARTSRESASTNADFQQRSTGWLNYLKLKKKKSFFSRPTQIVSSCCY